MHVVRQRGDPVEASEAARAGGSGALPTLIVIGAQKCGTSALHVYLDLHPEISMSQTKELNFFLEERNWPRGVDWYRRHFDPRAEVRGEASPNYTAHPAFPGAAERMHSVVPDAKLIYIVRDPLDRIAAHWLHNYAERRTRQSLREILRGEHAVSYIARSRYHMQLERFLRYYPAERILVLEQSDLRLRRAETLRSVFQFARVDPDFTHPRFRRQRHETKRKTTATQLGARLEERRGRARRRLLPGAVWALARERWPLGRRIERPDVRDALPVDVLAGLREDSERLRELTGRRFEQWSIWEE